MFTKIAAKRLISLLQDGWVPEGTIKLHQKDVGVHRTIDDLGQIFWRDSKTSEEMKARAVRCSICGTVFRAAGDVRCPDCGIVVIQKDNLVPEYDGELEQMENMSVEEIESIPTWEQFYQMIDECTVAQK